MAVPDILYKGVPRGVTRGYTRQVVQAVGATRAVVPCVGAWALATTAREAGVEARNIVGCDIALYPSVLGALVSGLDVPVAGVGRMAFLSRYIETGELPTRWKWRGVGEGWSVADEAEYGRAMAAWDGGNGRAQLLDAARGVSSDVVRRRRVAAVTWAVRVCQYEGKRDGVWVRERTRELWEGVARYVAQAEAGADAVLAKLAGAEYRVQDMWQLLGEWRGVGRAASEGVVVLCNPPRYDGGYEKMFAGVEQVVAWDAPVVAQFGEADYQRLMDWWGEAAEESPLMLVYYATSIAGGGKDPAMEWGGGWRSVFAARPKSAETAAINWVVASREPRAATSGARVAVGLQRQDVEPEVRAKYKLFREGEITAASELRMVTETKAVASYYRDLMTHRLGMINAERYKMLLLDGELMGCVGVHLQNLRSSGTLSGWAKLVFAMSPEHVRYRLLHKLTLMCVVSTWFWQGDVGDMELLPHGVQTTMLTRWPEVKTARGIFTLHEREYSQAKMEYRLTYQAKLTERTPAETVCEWVKRYGSEMKRGSGITQTSGVSGR